MSSDSSSMTLINPSQAAINRLPSPILVEIFETSIILDLLERDSSQRWSYERPLIQVLGAVCFTWRRIAWTTPHLWTKINLTFNCSDIRSQIHLLKLYLVNAGNLPLELGLWWESGVDPATTTDVLVDSSVDEMIGEALGRITWLFLCSPPSLSSWLSRVPELVSLEYLTINESRLPHNVPFNLSGLIKLSKFDTYDLRSDVILPWRSITTLHLSCAPVEICVKLLLQCQNLEFCAMDGGLLDAEPYTYVEPLYISTPIVLPRMKKIIWECLGTPWEELILRHVQMPHLRDLWWIEEPSADPNDLLLAEFFRRLPVGLRSVKLISNSPNGFPLLFMPPNVDVRKMEFASFVFSPTVLGTIINPLKPRIMPQPFWPFPRLNILRIYRCSSDPVTLTVENTIELLVTLAFRAGTLGQMITLDIDGVTLSWDPARFPGPLYGGENLIVRQGANHTVPLWYRQLVPGVPVDWDEAYDSDDSD